jgi:hypothetical protein
LQTLSARLVLQLPNQQGRQPVRFELLAQLGRGLREVGANRAMNRLELRLDLVEVGDLRERRTRVAAHLPVDAVQPAAQARTAGIRQPRVRVIHLRF